MSNKHTIFLVHLKVFPRGRWYLAGEKEGGRSRNHLSPQKLAPRTPKEPLPDKRGESHAGHGHPAEFDPGLHLVR